MDAFAFGRLAPITEFHLSRHNTNIPAHPYASLVRMQFGLPTEPLFCYIQLDLAGANLTGSI